MTDSNDSVENSEQEYLFGIPIRSLGEGIQPLECFIIVKGINMEDGMPTMTTIGSEGFTMWEIIGMMQVELERLKFMTVYSAIQSEADEDEDEDEE